MTNLDLVNQSFLIETDFFFETKKGNIWKPFLRNSEGNQWKISHCLSYNCQLSLDLGTKKKKGWISLFKDRIQKVIELRTWERYSETNKKDGHHPINPKKKTSPQKVTDTKKKQKLHSSFPIISWPTLNSLKKTCKKIKKYNTKYSRVVTHHSTDLALRSLACVIGRERAFSSRYGRIWLYTLNPLLVPSSSPKKTLTLQLLAHSIKLKKNWEGRKRIPRQGLKDISILKSPRPISFSPFPLPPTLTLGPSAFVLPPTLVLSTLSNLVLPTLSQILSSQLSLKSCPLNSPNSLSNLNKECSLPS